MNQVIEMIDQATNILIVQADNPDADSLGSSLALESILGDNGKMTTMFCGVDIPEYLRYLQGWDRVVKQVPNDFDLSIIVDTSALLLLETLDKSGELKWLKSKPCIVIDHHETNSTIDFAEMCTRSTAVATAEIIYDLANQAKWPITAQAGEFIITAILSDSMGLTSENTTSRSIHVIGEIVQLGASMAKIDQQRRQHQKKQPILLSYKGRLLQRIEYSDDHKIAYITIPWDEIEKYSPLYNPPMLIMDEMRQVEDVCVAIAFKTYPDGRITGKIRANYGYPVASDLAEFFGGGGHKYASGFRVTDGRKIEDIKSVVLSKTNELLSNLERANK